MRVNKELCYYKKVWNIENIPDVSSSITNEEKTNLVIFSDDDQWYYEFHKNNFEYVSKFQGINNEDSINSFIKSYNELPNYRKQIIIVLEQIKFSDKITEDYIHSLFAPVLKLSKFIISKKEKNVQWIIVNPCTFNSENPYYDALEGFFKTLITEHPDHQVMIVNTQYRDKLQIVQNIKLELSRNSDIFSHIAFHNNKRFVMKYKFENIKNKKAVLRQNGTYLITGGTGGIGKTIARFLCDEFSANVILVGRRKENSEIRNFLSETMNVTDGKICYFSCDIADEKSDLELIRNVNLQFGKINGVFHCAGVTNDCFIVNKEIDNVKEVFDSKITGLVSLEKSLENNNLDFMILFSSLSSATGNMGQCDYAYANAFLDAYSIWKSSQNTERITLSLNWPLWEDGGMQVSDEIIEYLKNSIGLFAINKECGAKAIVQTLGTSGGNYIIGYGDVVKIKDKMEKIFCKKNINDEADKNKSEILIKKTQELISDIFSDVFKIKKSQVLIRKKFQDYGVDSIIVEKFNIKLEEILGPMPKTLLFEYNSIESLSVYLAEEYKNVLNNYFNVNKKDVFNNKLNEKSWKKLTPIKEQIIKKDNACKKNCDIAIIGMSFDFPGASNEDELWDLLSQGKSAVTEIPHNRFEWNDLFEEDPILARKEGKIYCKWGGFIHDVDKFDALFFNVMPKDAQSMDPQERLFLMHSWKAIEDAGYSRKRLKKVKCGQTESAVGVFAATTSNTYQFYGTEAWKNGSKVIPSSLEWSLANRVSYVMDLHGPSMPVDTACSSGLVAVHLACESLKNDECSMAIAGGVNLYLHPIKYVAMCQMQMISKSGVCSAFGSNADGFVPGEGIGVIVLKKLEDAKRDKDHIYGIIKGSSVNHGGSTNGYTVPNPNAQSLVIQDALKKASVNARDISYVEAHGTGTILGDPIEIRGITDAYRKTTNDNQFCSIGSIKTNMGHLEGAAGIASIIKVLLQMKHKKLFPSLNAEELNPNIDFENSPFYVQKELSDWEGKTTDNIKNDQIRLSGVSSFGAGGANCHLIMQDYQDVSDENIHNNIVDNKNEKYLFILSAKTSKALREYASEFYKYILSLKKNMNYTSSKVSTDITCITKFIKSIISDICGVEEKQIDETESLESLGIEASDVEKLCRIIEDKYKKVYIDITFCICEIVDLLKDYNDKQYVYNSYENNILKRVAYTLQIGREDFSERLAFLASSFDECLKNLNDFLENKNENVLISSISKKELELSENYVFNPSVLSIEDVEKAWIKGSIIDWDEFEKLFYDGNLPVTISAITYPFQCESFWYTEKNNNYVLTLGTKKWIEKSFKTDIVKKVLNGDLFFVGDKKSYNSISFLPFKNCYFINSNEETGFVDWFKKEKNRSLPEIIICSFFEYDDESRIIKTVFDLMHDVLINKPEKGSKILIAGPVDNSVIAALSGLIKTCVLENPNLEFKLILCDNMEQFTENAEKELYCDSWNEEIKYSSKKRLVGKRVYIDSDLNDVSFDLGNEKVYIIAGGAGGIGSHFARKFAFNKSNRVVVLGRSKNPSVHFTEKNIEYYSCDITDEKQVLNFKKYVKEKYNRIDGIIQCTGIFRNNFVIRKSNQEFFEVIAPKVYGTKNLDNCFADEKLDFFVLFSSLAGEIGKVGQSDYSYANSFLNNFSYWRNNMVKLGKRSGKTISIEWPLWDKGGMTLSLEEQAKLSGSIGMQALPVDYGINAFYYALASNYSELFVLYGVREKVLRYVDGKTECEEDNNNSNDVIKDNKSKNDINLRSELIEVLRRILSEEIGMNKDQLHIDTTFDELGIDSIVINQFNADIEPLFGDLPKTILFENKSISEVADYLLMNEYESIYNYFIRNNSSFDNNITDNLKDETIKREGDYVNCASSYDKTSSEPEDNCNDIAIIGISGRYPMANSMDELWENLKEKKNCITEIRKDRWDYLKYYDSDVANLKEGKLYCKWGGFIDDIDKFDPMFFNIAPKEAEVMDPQERIMLQTAYEAIEDAGYSRKMFEEKVDNELTADVGVFVGATTHSYHLLNYSKWLEDQSTIVNPACWSIANRISYVLNFNGPSVFVDTACSSGLTALHLACQSIISGECKAAISGGVNLYVHPSKYISMCQIHMLSSSGKCSAFDEAADGMVPGEGVGAVLLKSLSQAEADNDHIYAVIKGSAINHGGKTNGYSVPNPKAQTALIKKAIKNANVDPRTITTIEAHGTGTSLGDPLEIVGLKNAYTEYTDDIYFCGVGSIKTNIGHLEAAAGFAGLAKIILEMKHKTLLPLINYNKLNEKIQIDNSPFYIQYEMKHWERPRVKENGEYQEYPRRAGLSAFGAGGSNAHFIIEEYCPKKNDLTMKKENEMIVLSAKNKDRLKEYALRMSDYLNKKINVEYDKSLLDFKLFITKVNDLETNTIKLNSEIIEKHLEAFVKLQRVAQNTMMSVLKKMGIFECVGEKNNLSFYIKKAGIIRKYERLFESILEMLERGGFLSIDSDNVTVLNTVVDSEYLCTERNSNNLSEMYPELKVQICFLKVCLKDYEMILNGKIKSQDVMFPNGSMDLVQDLYKDNEILDYYNSIIAKATVEYSRQIHENDNSRIVRILEIGAGTGGTSAFVLKELNKYKDFVSYCYTDISSAFTRYGKKTYGNKYDFVNFKVFDVEKSPDEFGLRLHDYDIVIATNVLHATQNMDNTISNASKLLKNSGLLIVNEVVCRMDSSTLTFGLTDGWWLYEDADIRIPNSPLISLENWKQLFERNNLLESEFIGLPGKSPEESGQSVMIGRLYYSENDNDVFTLEEVAHTLQTGREAFRCRMGFLSDNLKDTCELFKSYAEGRIDDRIIYEQTSESVKHTTFSECLEEFNVLAASGNYDMILKKWVNGSEFDFSLLWKEKSVSKISLPTYPFEKRRIWVDEYNIINADNDEKTSCEMICKKADEMSVESLYEQTDKRFYMIPNWVHENIKNTEVSKPDHVIILSNEDSSKIADKIAEEYQDIDCHVIPFINFSQIKDCLNNADKNVWIVYLGGIKNISEFVYNVNKSIQEDILSSVLWLIKHIDLESKINCITKMVFVTNNVHKILETDEPLPYAGGLSGLIRSIVKEYPNIPLSCIDIDYSDKSKNDEIDDFVSYIISEPQQKHGEEVAFRNGVRYIRKIVPTVFDNSNKTAFKENGIYVIAGGMGNIGYNLALHLSKVYHARIALLGRSDENETIIKKIDKVNLIGGKCIYIKTDISSMESIVNAKKIINNTFGAVDGVINSAMVFSQIRIADMTMQDIYDATNVKIYGSINLEEVFKSDHIDFIMLFSSGQTFMCNAERGHYAYGCGFQDAYSEYLNNKGEVLCKVINWGFWGAEGNTHQETEYNKIISGQGVIPIYPALGISAIENVMYSSFTQVLCLGAKDFVLQLMGVDMEHWVICNKSNNNMIDFDVENVLPLDEMKNREAEESFEQYGRILLAVQIRKMLSGDYRVSTINELINKLNIIPKYYKLFEALVHILKNGSFVRFNNEYIEFEEKFINGLPELDTTIEKGKKLSERYQELKDYIRLLTVCLTNYPKILTGGVPATDIMFPNSSMELVEPIYKGNTATHYFNELVVKSVISCLKGLTDNNKIGKKVKILEVGAGSGGTSQLIFEAIRKYGFEDSVEYVYTDISKVFTNYGYTTYGSKYSFIKFKILNIEKEGVSQGFENADFDIVIAANVLHATKNMNNTIRNIKSLMKNNGSLILNEATCTLEFSTMTFGLTDGWWLFNDSEIRVKGSPILSKKAWKDLLYINGFKNINVLGSSNISGKEIFQNVITACSDGKYYINTESINEKSIKSDCFKPVVIKDIISDSDIKSKLVKIIANVLLIPENEVKADESFMDMGADSILGSQIVTQINNEFSIEIMTTDLFEHVNIDSLSDFVSQKLNCIAREDELIHEDIGAGKISKKSDNIDYIDAIKKIIGDVLNIPMAEIDIESSFMDMGVDSILAGRLIRSINEKFEINLATTELFENVNIKKLAEYISENDVLSILNKLEDNIINVDEALELLEATCL